MGIIITIVTLLSTVNLLLAEEVRCFCNLPQCITTGYMCKAAAAGGCFSDLSELRVVHKARHGCAAQLDSSRQGKCHQEPSSRRDHQRSLLLCCYSDMCNHVDSLEVQLRVNYSFLVPASSPAVESRANYGATDADVWFRAATIAVPISGAFILFLLVTLAVHLLRRDAATAAVVVVPKQEDGGVAMKKVPLLRRQRDAGDEKEGPCCVCVSPCVRSGGPKCDVDAASGSRTMAKVHGKSNVRT